jgi:hypothetical protein
MTEPWCTTWSGRRGVLAVSLLALSSENVVEPVSPRGWKQLKVIDICHEPSRVDA